MYVARPPDFAKLVSDIKVERLMALLNTPGAAGTDHEYIHWDKLRHLTPPGDLKPEEWWLAIKFTRGTYNQLPLVDMAGSPFTYGVPPSLQRLLHYVDQHCGGEIAMAEVVTTDQQARHHYLVNSLMEEAIRSSQLEGATTSRRVAKELLRTGRPPRDRSELMILNNYRGLEFMRERMHDELTPDLVMTLQRILTEGTLDDPSGAGRLQTPDEVRASVVDATDGSIIHHPPPAEQLAERMDAMCRFANSQDEDGVFIHPVVRGILLHFWMAYDHPFLDGNGRTARALFYWYMRARGYWLTEYLSISRILRKSPSKYATAFLLTETDGGDTTYFLLHQLEVIERATKELQAYLRRKVKEVQETEKLMKDAAELNHRQLALLSDAIRHPGNTYSYQSHATSHKVTIETARTDLTQLQQRGLLQRRKSGRRHVYSAVEDLSQALASS